MNKVIGIVGTRRRDTDEDNNLTWLMYDIPIKIHKAEWSKYGRGAGMVRNTYIAQDADVILAVVALDRKGGTEDTIKKALKLGKKVICI
jgi:hypothetical protein